MIPRYNLQCGITQPILRLFLTFFVVYLLLPATIDVEEKAHGPIHRPCRFCSPIVGAQLRYIDSGGGSGGGCNRATATNLP